SDLARRPPSSVFPPLRMRASDHNSVDVGTRRRLMMICHGRARTAMLVALFAALPAAASAQPQSAQPASKPKAAQAATPAAVEPRLDPKALELLKAMSARLAGARTMSFTAVSTYESPSQIGLPLAYATESEVTLQRPDKLKVITPGDGPATEVYYDGKTIMAYAPAENLVAV